MPDLMAALEASLAAAEGRRAERQATARRRARSARAAKPTAKPAAQKPRPRHGAGEAPARPRRRSARPRPRRREARRRRGRGRAAGGCKLSNLDKVLYPAVGFTKGQVIDYYTRIAPVAAAAPARPAADAEALSRTASRASTSTRSSARRTGPTGCRPSPVQAKRQDDRLLPRQRPADAGLGGEPGRPRAAHLALAAPRTSSARR